MNIGKVKGAEIRIDPAHNGKPDYIDAHIFYLDRNATKLNMTGVVEASMSLDTTQINA